MINENEYKLLSGLKDSPLIDEVKYYYELKTFFKDELVAYNITGETPTATIYNGFLLTPKGERAIEEYENFQKTTQRELETVSIARESNDIAKAANKLSEESNHIAKKANRLSKNSNILSIIAIIVSVVCCVITAIATIHSGKSCSRKAQEQFVDFNQHNLFIINK